MSLLLRKLTTKRDIDKAIRSTEDLVLVLRFGRESDLTCMQLDEIVSNNYQHLCFLFISSTTEFCLGTFRV